MELVFSQLRILFTNSTNSPIFDLVTTKTVNMSQKSNLINLLFLFHMEYTSLFGKLFHEDTASRTSVWIFCDHTFKSAANIGFVRESDGKWIKLFKCVFIVIGEGGHILHWKFTRGESFEEVRDIFIQLKERLQARGVVIDNCCKWKSSLTAISRDVDIGLDLFHAVQRFLKTIPVGASIGKVFSVAHRI